MLLLSVLPPVIPRASWPSAEHCVLNHGVTFNSEPQLDEVAGGSNDCAVGEEDATNKLSVFGKLMNILGPRGSGRKTSSVSYAGAGTGGIAAALKVHMGYIAGLVPSNKSRSGSLDSSSNVSRYCVKRDIDDDNFQKRVKRIFNEDDSDDENPQTFARSSQSLSHRVSFSIQHQHSQPVLKVRGSPRFPHRIVPTCSLDALESHPNPPQRNKCRSLEDASGPSQSNPLSNIKTESTAPKSLHAS